MTRTMWCAVVGLLFCCAATPAAAERPASPRRPSERPFRLVEAASPGGAWIPAPQELDLDELPPLDGLTPLESGPGILVCEPVPRGADAATAALGAGCARWLQLVVGGHGELGRTPLWSHVEYARQQMKKPDLRLLPADLPALHRYLGLTHAALGEIRREGAQYSLSFQLHRVPSGEPAGEPVRLTGTAEELVSKLPAAAVSLLKLLQVPAPRVPAGIGETAAELTALGRLPWVPEQNTASAERELLLASRDLTLGRSGGSERPARPFLGCFLCLLYGRTGANPTILNRSIEALRAQVRENALVDAEIGKQLYLSRATTRLGFELPEAADLLRKFPQNQALWATQTYLYRLPQRNLEVARKAAEMQARAAGENPEAWILFGDTIQHQFARIRWGRPFEEQNEADQEACLNLLMEELVVRLKTVALAPEHPVAWMQLSYCEARLGQPSAAEDAFDRALELDPENYTNLGWGVALFSPGWFDNPPKLKEVAEKAVSVGKGWILPYRIEMYLTLRRAGLPDLAEKLILREAERFRFEEALPRK